MRRALSYARASIGRFAGHDRGVAVVEFALILPFMLFLYIGTIELSEMIIVDRRVTSVAGTVGDLVARSNGTISNATLDSYFDAAQAIMAPYSTTNLKQVVTLISVAANGDATVVWSRGHNGGVAKTEGASFDLPATSEINQIARGSYLVVAHTEYSYTAMLEIVFDDTINYARQNYFVPRYADIITKTD